jgi:hypothetical protein
VGRNRAVRFLSAGWVIVSSACFLLFGAWMVWEVPSWWQKFVLAPNLVHGAICLGVFFQLGPSTRAFLASSVILIGAWFGGSFDSGVISGLEAVALLILALGVLSQYWALSLQAKKSP